MSKRWTYKVVEAKLSLFGLKPKQVEDVLGPLGAQGWELVAVVQSGITALLYLKKEI